MTDMSWADTLLKVSVTRGETETFVTCRRFHRNSIRLFHLLNPPQTPGWSEHPNRSRRRSSVKAWLGDPSHNAAEATPCVVDGGRRLTPRHRRHAHHRLHALGVAHTICGSGRATLSCELRRVRRRLLSLTREGWWERWVLGGGPAGGWSCGED